jgi:hypothetical protein
MPTEYQAALTQAWMETLTLVGYALLLVSAAGVFFILVCVAVRLADDWMSRREARPRARSVRPPVRAGAQPAAEQGRQRRRTYAAGRG